MSSTKNNKTNVARLLDKAGIEYELKSYEVDENDLSATTLASKLGLSTKEIFKTIVLIGNKTGAIVAVIASDDEVDLKKMAKVTGNKSVSPLAQKDLLATAGYIRGACSPIGMKKNYPTVFDIKVLEQDKIYVSAGQRGLQIRLSSDKLIKYINAKIEDIAL